MQTCTFMISMKCHLLTCALRTIRIMEFSNIVIASRHQTGSMSSIVLYTLIGYYISVRFCFPSLYQYSLLKRVMHCVLSTSLTTVLCEGFLRTRPSSGLKTEPKMVFIYFTREIVSKPWLKRVNKTDSKILSRLGRRCLERNRFSNKQVLRAKI